MKSNIKHLLKYNRIALEDSDKSLRDIFEIMFNSKGNILCEGNDGFKTYKYTYGDIYNRIISVANGIHTKVGAKHKYIALEIENSADWIVAFWAILMSGNKPYLVNLRYPQHLTANILKTLEIEHIICAKDSSFEGTVLRVADLEIGGEKLPADIFEDEIAFSSSATSMNEVICFFNGESIAEQILNFKSIVKESPRIAKHYKGELKQLAFLPFYHIFGLFAVYFWFTFFGRTLVFLKDYSADTILNTCRRHKVTHIFAIPMLWHTVEKQVLRNVSEKDEKTRKKFYNGLKTMTAVQNIFPSFGAALAKKMMSEVTDKLFGDSLLFCINGGSYLRDSAIELFNGLGYCMHNGYGMSEIGITSVELRSKPSKRNLNSIGHPFDSVEYKLDDAGILSVKGTSLCQRKLVNGEEIIVDGWFNTGDIMVVKDDHYFISGRKGDVVIGENGENINPDTIEKNFIINNAQMFSVLGIEGENGQELAIVIQISPYATNNILNEIKNKVYEINSTIPATMAIKKFYFTKDELAPPTAVKVSRTQLLKKIADKEVTLTPFNEMILGDDSNPENSPLLNEICKIIAETLNISLDSVKPDSHIFFDLEATSIQYFSILSALSEKFSVSGYDKNDKYRYTPREISEYIERYL